MASAILITTSEELAQKVSEEIDGFVAQVFQERQFLRNPLKTTATF